MSEPSDDSPIREAIADAMSAVFQSLGRGLLCLDASFTVVHASPNLDELAGDGSASAVLGQSVDAILGPDLFTPGGSLRRSVEAGERREGWGATLRAGSSPPVRVSITIVPFSQNRPTGCDTRVAYLVVLRPSDETMHDGGSAPTLFSGLVARSPAMQRLFRFIENLEASDATVLLTGESGTGKELVARAIHVHSPRSRGPFVAVNCGAIPGELLEGEMFGHQRGAFTGAVRDRVGRFELASEGTLFLDEVAELPPALQVKLLRVLQERTYERLGENRTRETQARIIAATNRDLERAVSAGTFREDLYYRLRVIPIELPSLRVRREDVEPIARHLLDRVAARNQRELRLAPDSVRALVRYSWPGNVRELENALEYATAVCRGQTIEPRHLPDEVRAGRSDRAADEGWSAPSLEGGGDERERLREALQAHRWRRDDTARALGMSRTTLWRKMREHKLAN